MPVRKRGGRQKEGRMGGRGEGDRKSEGRKREGRKREVEKDGRKEGRGVRKKGVGGERGRKRGTVAKASHGQRFPMPPFQFLRRELFS